MRSTTMTVFSALVLLLVNVQLSCSCDEEGTVMICRNVPSHFSPGFLTLVMYVNDIGEINSTVFRSSSLNSVTRLRIDNAGVTGIAEGAFSSFHNLTRLSLEKNAVTEVNSDWFGRPALLSELSLAENQIEALNGSMLHGLINLKKLSLSQNRIRTIDPNSFRSQTNLTELDLSENRMTLVSPQVFGPLRSTRIRLDGNPWDCSCGAEDFVDFLKDLQSRSLLDRQMEVTCESPPPLRGRPAWNVSVCVTSPTPGPPSVSRTVHLKATDALPSAPASSAKVATTPSQSTSKSETSVQAEPTDAPTVMSSHAAPPARPTSETSVHSTSTETLRTVPAQTATHVTPASSETETLVPPHTGVTEMCVTSQTPSDTNTVCALTVVIVVLCALLFVVCFLAVRHRRKRSNKTVTPGRPEEEKNTSEEDSGSNDDRSPVHSEDRDPGAAWRRPFTGVRAKSANAVLFISPFSSGKDRVTVQNETEAQSKDADRKQEVENQTEATENVTNATDMVEKTEKADAGGTPDENLHCVSVSTDTVLYLSIGPNHNKPNPDPLHQHPTDSLGQRSQTGRVMGRISTWPLTAVQWQARCQMKEEEDNETEEFPGGGKKSENKVQHPSVSDPDKNEDEIEENQMEDLQTAPNQDPLKLNTVRMKSKHTQSSELSEDCSHTDVKQEDPASVRQNLNQEKLSQNQDLNPAGNPAHNTTSKKSSSNEPNPAATSRHRPENRSTGSKAPSGGASPDDETLLHGNEYAFMDLLHEVVQNNGRWTRERWRQIHVNKPRR